MSNHAVTSGGTSNTGDPDADGWVVPLFPLPNVVLLPSAVLPLHIFEERYKVMTRDALAGNGRIAMALLRPGWEMNYYSRPDIEPVVCVGQILSHEELPDGRFNFLLRGVTRAKVVRELAGPSTGLETDRPYRLARVRPIKDRVPSPEALESGRDALRALFRESALARTPAGRQFAELVDSHVATSALADLVAFSFVEDVAVKQALLAEPDVSLRLQRVIRELGVSAESPASDAVRQHSRPSLN